MDREKMKNELDSLVDEGADIYFATTLIYDKGAFSHHDEEMENMAKECAKKIKFPHGEYYIWYDKTCNALRVLASKKFEEFQNFYTNYTEEWIIDRTKDSFFKFEKGFRMQRYILASINKNFDTPFFNLERDIRHDIYKSTMDIAKEIQEEDPRIAGAIASVMLEVHLKKIAIKHGIEDKENNSIADYNNFLKTKRVYDGILADQIKPCRKIRNKCIHTNQGDPSVGEVSTIIHIADRVIAEVN